MRRKTVTKTLVPYLEEQRFRAIIEKSFDVIVLLDRKGKILYASPSIVRLFGRDYDEFIGVTSFTFIHRSDLPKVLKHVGWLLLHPSQSVSAEFRIRHKNGSWRWVIATGTNFLKDKEIQALVVNFHDITERKELEERKDEFISIASHELKTPITALKGYVQILKTRYKTLDPFFTNALDRIEEQTQRLTGLVSDLLDVSKIQEGKLHLKKDHILIDTLIQDVVSDIRQTASTHKILLRKQAKTKVYIDKDRITQVLVNLITNAIKYSPNNSQIFVQSQKKKDFVVIHIRDQGKGIAEKNLPKVFERFFQETQSENHTSGLGLGLYICSIIIKHHGGTIWVDSKKGKGTTFSFSLPTEKA